MDSKIEEGVYRRYNQNGRVGAIQFDLNRASRQDGNAIGLMPAAAVPKVNGQEVGLVVRLTALRRILDDPEVREALGR